MCQKNFEEENIIEYILRKTGKYESQNYINYRKAGRPKGVSNRVKNKDHIEMFYCESCKRIWHTVEVYINKNKWQSYSKEIIPAYGKEKKECKKCENINRQKK